MDSQVCCIPSCTPCTVEFLASRMYSITTAEQGTCISEISEKNLNVIVIGSVVLLYFTSVFQILRLVMGDYRTKIVVKPRCYRRELSAEEDGNSDQEDEECEEGGQDGSNFECSDTEEGNELEKGERCEDGDEDERGEDCDPEEGESGHDSEIEGEEEDTTENVQADVEQGWEVTPEEVSTLRKRVKRSRECGGAAAVVDPLISLCRANGIEVTGETEKFFKFVTEVAKKCGE